MLPCRLVEREDDVTSIHSLAEWVVHARPNLANLSDVDLERVWLNEVLVELPNNLQPARMSGPCMRLRDCMVQLGQQAGGEGRVGAALTVMYVLRERWYPGEVVSYRPDLGTHQLHMNINGRTISKQVHLALNFIHMSDSEPPTQASGQRPQAPCNFNRLRPPANPPQPAGPDLTAMQPAPQPVPPAPITWGTSSSAAAPNIRPQHSQQQAGTPPDSLNGAPMQHSAAAGSLPAIQQQQQQQQAPIPMLSPGFMHSGQQGPAAPGGSTPHVPHYGQQPAPAPHMPWATHCAVPQYVQPQQHQQHQQHQERAHFQAAGAFPGSFGIMPSPPPGVMHSTPQGAMPSPPQAALPQAQPLAPVPGVAARQTAQSALPTAASWAPSEHSASAPTSPGAPVLAASVGGPQPPLSQPAADSVQQVMQAAGPDPHKRLFEPQDPPDWLNEGQGGWVCGQGYIRVLAWLQASGEQVLAVQRALLELPHAERLDLYRRLCVAFRITNEEVCRAALYAVLQDTLDRCEGLLEAADSGEAVPEANGVNNVAGYMNNVNHVNQMHAIV